MLLTTQVALHPTPEQFEKLLELLGTFNRACNDVARRAMVAGVFSRIDIRNETYQHVKITTGLGATYSQLVAQKVAQAYKLDKTQLVHFRAKGAIPLNLDTFCYKRDNIVDIKVGAERIRVKFEAREDVRLTSKKAAQLVLFRDRFYLHQSIEIEEKPIQRVTSFLGIDMGIKNIAYDSDGVRYSGAQLNNMRRRHARLRRRLQRLKTKSAKRLLRKRREKESLFARDVNHRISKRLVEKASCTARGLAIEDLEGVVKRCSIKAKKPQRIQLGRWAFYQLRMFLAYKAEREGVPLVAVDPRYTSQTCSSCGCRDKKNRRNQARFKCIRCGRSAHADHNAAINVAAKAATEIDRAVGSQPHADGVVDSYVTQETLAV